MEEINMSELELEELKKAVGAGEANPLTKDLAFKVLRHLKYDRHSTLEGAAAVMKVLFLSAPFDGAEFARTWYAYL